MEIKNISIEELINKELQTKNNEKENKEQTTWWASSLGSCLRGQYFKRLGIKSDKKITERELRVFDVGNKMEEWLIDLISKQGGEIEKQVRVEIKEWNASGKVDLIRNKRPYEIKTKHSKAFWYMQKEGKPMRQHEQQLWFYLRALNLSEGNLVYLSKDDLAVAEYIVRLDDEKLKNEVKEQFNLLNLAWDIKNPLLLPLPDKNVWQAKYCQYHDKCVNEKMLKQKVAQKIKH